MTRKKTYAQPTLTLIGGLVGLTRSGGSPLKENAGMPNSRP
jgi:hypothetical protein